jgi:hypothetical protein
LNFFFFTGRSFVPGRPKEPEKVLLVGDPPEPDDMVVLKPGLPFLPFLPMMKLSLEGRSRRCRVEILDDVEIGKSAEGLVARKEVESKVTRIDFARKRQMAKVRILSRLELIDLPIRRWIESFEILFSGKSREKKMNLWRGSKTCFLFLTSVCCSRMFAIRESSQPCSRGYD